MDRAADTCARLVRHKDIFMNRPGRQACLKIDARTIKLTMRTASTVFLVSLLALPFAAAPATSPAAQRPGFMLGEWVGAPCKFVFDQDDGHAVGGDCSTPTGLHHVFRGSYTTTDTIVGTFERIDPNGCRITVPGTIRIDDENRVDYTLPAWRGCGLNGVGAANRFPITRASAVPGTAAPSPPPAPRSIMSLLPQMPPEMSQPTRSLSANEPPAVFRLCEGVCSQPWRGACEIFKVNECVTANYDRDAYDIVWDHGGTRERVAIERWKDGQISLKLIASPVRDGYQVQWTGALSRDGAIYGDELITRSRHTTTGESTPTQDHSPFKAMLLEPPATTPGPCTVERLPPVGSIKAMLDAVYATRNAGDFAAAGCWLRAAANSGISAAYDQVAFDLLYGTVTGRRDYAGALTLAQKAGDENSWQGLKIAAKIYRDGMGVPRDLQKAAQYEARARVLEVREMKTHIRNQNLNDLPTECETDWGLMTDAGYNCYAIMAELVVRAARMPGDCPDIPGPYAPRDEREAAEQCQDNHTAVVAEARERREAAKQRVLGDCNTARGWRLSDGSTFDVDRCMKAATAAGQ